MALFMAFGQRPDGGGPATTPSGACGLAGLLHAAARPHLPQQHLLDASSTILLIATEGLVPNDG